MWVRGVHACRKVWCGCEVCILVGVSGVGVFLLVKIVTDMTPIMIQNNDQNNYDHVMIQNHNHSRNESVMIQNHNHNRYEPVMIHNAIITDMNSS